MPLPLSLGLSLPPFQLTKLYGMDHPPLPGFKRLFGFGLFGSTKPSQIEEMRKNLEGFIMGAVTSWTVPPTELLKFVEYPFTVSHTSPFPSPPLPSFPLPSLLSPPLPSPPLPSLVYMLCLCCWFEWCHVRSGLLLVELFLFYRMF